MAGQQLKQKEAVVEEQPQGPGEQLLPGERKLNAFTVLTLIVSASGGLCFGLDIGTAATTSMDGFRHDMGLPLLVPGETEPADVTNKITMFAWLFHLSSMIGAPFAGWLADRVGRRPAIVASGVLFALGALWQTLAGLVDEGFAWESILLGRFLGGIGNGFMLVLFPVYASELAPASLRGKVLTMFQFSITIGILIMAVFNQEMADVEWAWRLGIALQILPCVFIVLVAGLVLPESPRFLLQAGKREQAERALRKLAVGTPSADAVVKAELQVTQEEVDVEASLGKGSFLELFEGANLPATLCAMGIAGSQNVSGVNWFMSWATTLFNSLGFNPFAMDLVLKTLNCVATLAALPLVDRLGRLFLTQWGTSLNVFLFCMLALVIVATGVDVNDANPDSTTEAVQGLAAAVVFTFQVGFAITWGPMGWLVPSEVFPLRLRGVGMSSAVVMNMGTNIICGDWGYAALYSATSLQATTFIMGMFNLLLVAPIVIFLQPETKGYSLEEIRGLFSFRVGGDADRDEGTMTEFCLANARQSKLISTCRSIPRQNAAADHVRERIGALVEEPPVALTEIAVQ